MKFTIPDEEDFKTELRSTRRPSIMSQRAEFLLPIGEFLKIYIRRMNATTHALMPSMN